MTSDYERVAKVIRFLGENYLEQPDLARLARVAGLSEFHFHRMFSRWAGVTPKDFLKFLTAEHAKRLLAESRDILDASLESGLSGPGRLHDLLVSVEAMSPGEFKRRGEGLEIAYGVHETPFGLCLLGATSRGICHLAFHESATEGVAELKARWERARIIKESPRETERLFARIFSADMKAGKLPLLLAGTPFQLKIWQALLRIPMGKLVTYGDLASYIGAPGASRAVGTAVGRNPIAYLIPCHRVIRETGRFGEYRWGRERKQAILAIEGAGNRRNA